METYQIIPLLFTKIRTDISTDIVYTSVAFNL